MTPAQPLSALPAAPSLSMGSLIGALSRLSRLIDDGLRGGARRRLTELRRHPDVGIGAGGARVPISEVAVISLALLDDCLRIVHFALEADGRVDAEELDHVYPLVFTSASRYSRALGRYREFANVDGDGATAFLRAHRVDREPLGHACAATEWIGVALCREAARGTGNHELLADYERMALELLDEVLAVGGTLPDEVEARRQFADQLSTRLKLGGDEDKDPDDGRDPRAVAFCRQDGPDVFSSVAHPARVHLRDGLDVDAIHAEARQVFERLVNQATTPSQHDTGRMLLVRGESGAGKTHLMRAFRSQVHGHRLGYVSYTSLTSDSDDYMRYLLINLIDSLEKPYDLPELERQAMTYLSDGLAEHGDALSPDDLEKLRNADLPGAALGTFVATLVDALLRHEGMSDVDADVVHALLLVQRRDPAVTKRVAKFLRCEDLTAHERTLLGGIAPRLKREDPQRMIEQIGRIMWAVQQSALVLLVDQVEDVYQLDNARDRFRRAVAALRAVAERLPSSVVVLACLDDLWGKLRDTFALPDRDRLEKDPRPVTLRAQRTLEEIERMVARRLESLYVDQGAAFRADDPLFPFQRSQLEQLVNLRARDCLSWMKHFHEACILHGRIVDPDEVIGGNVIALPGPSKPELDAITALNAKWNAVRAAHPIPDDDDKIVELLATAATSCAADLPEHCELRATRESGRLTVSSGVRGAPLNVTVAGLTNSSAKGGGLQRQLEELQRTRSKHNAIAMRTSEFTVTAKTKVADAIAKFVKDGGRKLVIDNSALTAMAAYQEFARLHDREAYFVRWRQDARPLMELSCLRELFDLERLLATRAPAERPPEPKVAAATLRMPAMQPTVRMPAIVDQDPEPGDPQRLRIGVSAKLRPDPVTLDAADMVRHAVFLGTTGSGKTTLALNVIEQLLERGVAAILVDRKGDLCRYASEEWWAERPADPRAAARKAALRAKIRVQLFTPGDARGRALVLPLLPPGFGSAHEQEREKMAKYCASSLAALMGYGTSETHNKRTAVLKAALEIAGGEGEIDLNLLIETVMRPADEMLVRVSYLDRFFRQVAEDLQTLHINYAHLLAGSGDALDIGEMITPRDGKVPLTIISTKHLGEPSTLQFWVARFSVELARWLERHPSPQLQAIALFDEADRYLPATSSPPTKEPMMDLLRRARSKGCGIFLASQNPGDFDYKGRELFNTWFVGKVSQARSISKMKELLDTYPSVASLLAAQPTGQFFVLQGNHPREVRADRSLMETHELSGEEIIALARQQPAARR